MATSIKNKYSQLAKLGNITTKYGGQTRGESFHKGIDIANKKGTPLPAPTTGPIVAVKTGVPSGDNSYGNSIIQKDSKNNELHRYSHLDRVDVKPGDTIKKGEKIGTMGDSGNSYSPSGGDASHLDYRVLSAYGKYRDPAKKKKN